VSARVCIRDADRTDVELIFSMIVELAAYERARERVVGTPELLAAALFGAEPVAEAVIAEVSGEPAGFALFYTTFSTWQCLPGLWLEDLFVAPEHRRGGIGRALLSHVARIAVERACGRVEWSALDWNAPALAFYEGLGAETFGEWKMHRLDGAALGQVAELADADW
jgi:GNAT superfamily N-acetyltransferase